MQLILHSERDTRDPDVIDNNRSRASDAVDGKLTVRALAVPR